MVDAQKWLESQEKYNTKEKREKVTELYVRHRHYNYDEIEGGLNLNDFTNLERLYCDGNELTSLDLTNCEKLEKVNCSDNPLTSLVLPKDCPNLAYLDISDTDISEVNIDKLPNSLEKVCYSNDKRPDCKLTKIVPKLKKHEDTVIHWKDLHSDFTLKLRKEWGKSGLNKEQTKKWIELGFGPDDYDEVQKWKARKFDYWQVKEWIQVGLKSGDCNFANYLKNGKNLVPQEAKDNLRKLRKEYQQTKTWLSWNYPPTQRSVIQTLNISNKKLWGDCDLKDFINLKKLDCSNNEIISLTFSEDLTELDCSDNQLIELNLSKNRELAKLNCSNNLLTFLNLVSNLELTELLCSNKKPNREKLTSIIFSPDFESHKLERIDIIGNDKLDYVAIDKKFLKRLPDKLSYQTPSAINPQELTQIIRERADIKGEIKDIHFFSTWWNPNCALVVNKVVWYGVRLIVLHEKEKRLESQGHLKIAQGRSEDYVAEEDYAKQLKWICGNYWEERPKEFEIKLKIKIFEHIYKDEINKKVRELKIQLNSDNPILALYSHNFSPEEVIERNILPKEAEQEPSKYLRPTDLIWRTMNIPGAYHVAIYLGNKRVAHIGSSKFIKTSKINAKSNKALLGARNDHWLDFLKDAKELIRYRPLVPFKRPEKIQEHISQAILAEYGAKNYSFLGNNCEHFATLCVCSIPFSTQADKISLLTHKVYLDLAQEIKENDHKFAEMSNSKAFKENIRKLKLKEIKDLNSKSELIANKQEKITSLEQQLEELNQELVKITSEEINELESKGKLTEPEEKELDNLTKDLNELVAESSISDVSSIYSSTTGSSLNWWKQIISQKINIPGTIKKIIPFTTKENQVLVINKVVLYAVRLLEYNPAMEEVTELKKFPNDTKFSGYSTLKRALQKAHKILEKEENASELEQTDTTYQIEIPPKNNPNMTRIA